MRPDMLIKKDGFDILREKLGEVEMERFIVLLNRERFDYTQWRRQIFEDISLEDLARKADHFSKKQNKSK